MDKKYQREIKSEMQRLFQLLGVSTGIFNVECRVCSNGKPYLMEVSPRAGGNRLAEMLNYISDVNINAAETKKALGLPVGDIHEPDYDAHYAILVMHSNKDGIFDSVRVSQRIRSKNLLEEEIRTQKGTRVSSFSGANAAIGTLFLKLQSREELAHALEHQDEWLSINVI